MSFVKYQGQHRISKIYLKHFGYLKERNWYISVWYKSDNHTNNLRINDFTNETNVFDLPFEDVELRRYFEDFSNKGLENYYATIVKSIVNQQRLNSKHKNILFNFVANLICRTIAHRDFFNTLLLGTETIEIFLEEITTFEEEMLPVWKEALSKIKPEYQLNVVLGQIMMYSLEVLKRFDCVILKAPENRMWFTSDNPVSIDKQEIFNYLIPLEAEIYFPLSKDYCLFMFSDESEIKTNSLRALRKNKINEIDIVTHKLICDKITWNDNRYLVFPMEISETSLIDVC